MPPRDSADMPLPDLRQYDDSTFTGRLFKYGAPAEANVSDRRDETEEEATARKRYASKKTKRSADEDGDKLSADAGFNDIEKPQPKTAEQRMKNRYTSK